MINALLNLREPWLSRVIIAAMVVYTVVIWWLGLFDDAAPLPAGQSLGG